MSLTSSDLDAAGRRGVSRPRRPTRKARELRLDDDSFLSSSPSFVGFDAADASCNMAARKYERHSRVL